MKQYVVDSFSEQVFGGNPAAVCIMEQWLPDDLMLRIAQENNLSETAFAVKQGEIYKLRWFTPGGEVDLCGHATLATAYTILNYVEPEAEQVVFTGLSGELIVKRKGELYEMDFPIYALQPQEITEDMVDAIGARPLEAYLGRDLLCVFDSEEFVRNMQPDMDKLKQIPGLLLHATAAGKDADCVSRSFGPKLKITEDPVCGSGHCHIAPYWAKRLDQQEILAYQASVRGGTLYCRMQGDRIAIAGKAALYSIAEISTGPSDPVQV
ncbi:MAG: PhzF family phenazine biosynthesis protein [Firmicutes bacterium]|nr:PhzF family phenazine biosynthesis protein [Bacillota bacterium]